MPAFDILLKDVADWIDDAASTAKGALEITLQSEHLRATLSELCDLGGVTGAIFKLGSRFIPSPTPEQRIAAKLHQAFVKSLDDELKSGARWVAPNAWRRYVRDQISSVTKKKLAAGFTWLVIFGKGGHRPGRSWPIIGDLSDLARGWITEAASLDHRSSMEIQQFADDARGRIYEDLLQAMDSLLGEPQIAQAILEARSRTQREALALLAEEMTNLRRYRLFGELPQDSIYVPQDLKFLDMRGEVDALTWHEIKTTAGGEEALFHQIKKEHPRLIVIEGDMGVGKSCLMRLLASRLAEQYRSDRRLAPVYVRWRDIFDRPDLPTAIAQQLGTEYGLAFSDLPHQDNVVYLVDGFDEMSSHQESYVAGCFDSLSKIVDNGCSVVVAMRSTVITPGLRLLWKNRSAMVVEVQVFDNAAIDVWAQKWCTATGAMDVTGDRLRSLCRVPGRQNVAQNPLLLYMLAKYVAPLAQGGNGQNAPLTRTQIFRTFVDETIRGKYRSTREDFPIAFSEHVYRMFLQEIAWIASWPFHSTRCPARVIREMVRNSPVLEDLNFRDFRTAFVLHFFEPSDLSANEFEFQPEGFRQYLLAEWCVRAQIESLRDDVRREHPMTRDRRLGMSALAQFPLREEERYLLNEIYEELGRLAAEDPTTLVARLQAFGINLGQEGAESVIERLFSRLRDYAEDPPFENWEDDKVGVPEGQEIPSGFKGLRFMLNYWDQCLIGAFGLYRGLGKDRSGERIFRSDRKVLGRFLRARQASRGLSWTTDLNLSRLIMPGADLRNVILSGANLCNCDLQGADLERAVILSTELVEANLEKAQLGRADLTESNLANAKLIDADLRLAVLVRAKLPGAILLRALLEGATLEAADLSDAILDQANLSGADLHGARMERATLVKADLTGANLRAVFLRSAILSGADLGRTDLSHGEMSLANMVGAVLEEVRAVQANFRRANLSQAKLRGANLRGADLSLADLRQADLQNADLREANLSGANLDGANLKGARREGSLS